MDIKQKSEKLQSQSLVQSVTSTPVIADIETAIVAKEEDKPVIAFALNGYRCYLPINVAKQMLAQGEISHYEE